MHDIARDCELQSMHMLLHLNAHTKGIRRPADVAVQTITCRSVVGFQTCLGRTALASHRWLS